MKRYSDRAIEIINELHRERLDYQSEYLPLIDAANKLSAYEDTGLEPEQVMQTIDPESLWPTREQVEKVWRGEWIGSADGYADGELVYDIWECSECGYVIDEEDDPDMLPQFCPKCYAPMTDEAVDIVMERLEALKDG